MRPLSSRLKIALLSAVISGVVVVGFALVLWFRIHEMRRESLDREIRSVALRHPGFLAGRGNFERLNSSLEFTFGAAYTNRIILLLQSSGGRTLYASPNWPEELSGFTGIDLPAGPIELDFDPPERNAASGEGGRGFGRGGGRGGPPPPPVFQTPPTFQTATAGEIPWRIGTFVTDDFTLLIGLSEADLQAELNRLRNLFLLTLPAALFLVGFGGWIVAGRAVNPLRSIAEVAEKVTARGLDQRIPQSRKSPEAARVIQVLNRMMDRLEASFRQATRFSADASHELKTPLTVMQGELENALQFSKAGAPEQQLLNSLLEQVQHLKHITRSLLLLAQADAGQLKLALEPVDLSAEMEEIVEDARVLGEALRLEFQVKIEPDWVVQADRALLHTAVFNLVINAIKYNQAGGSVAVSLGAQGNELLLAIGNTGEGIPAEKQPLVFNRFARVRAGAHSNVEGVGLGLSLAREIVRAHGGELVLGESRPGWTSFHLTLPATKSR